MSTIWREKLVRVQIREAITCGGSSMSRECDLGRKLAPTNEQLERYRGDPIQSHGGNNDPSTS